MKGTCAGTHIIRVIASRPLLSPSTVRHVRCLSFSATKSRSRFPDPRLSDLGHLIEDEYATVQDSYLKPKHPIVLAHGLLGFDELQVAKNILPSVQYWRGIKDAYSINGIEVITAPVSPSASIERRAEQLKMGIESHAQGRKVNIIAGLDARYMISRLKPAAFDVVSLTTIATPHRGSIVADHIIDWMGEERLAQAYFLLDRLGMENGAFKQLTRKYMDEEFNPNTPDMHDTRYFSYGAFLKPKPWSVFRQSHRILETEEGPNDGLVSVSSSKWGCYKGTLAGVSHLDLINWTNRFKWLAAEMTGTKKKFNAIAFYLDIADVLAKEGL